jgi:hypothetical protein
MASPHVAGAAAMVMSRFPYVTWQDVCARLCTAVVNEQHWAPLVRYDGRLNVARAVGVWLDFAYAGPEDGTFSRPYNTLNEGLSGLPERGHLLIRSGETNWTGLLDSPGYIVPVGGAVTIGN